MTLQAAKEPGLHACAWVLGNTISDHQDVDFSSIKPRTPTTTPTLRSRIKTKTKKGTTGEKKHMPSYCTSATTPKRKRGA